MNKSDLIRVLEQLIRTHPDPAIRGDDGKGNQNEIARQSGMHQPTLQRILSGNSKDPRDSTIRPLAEFFGVSIPQLRGYEPLSKPTGGVGESQLPGYNNVKIIARSHRSVPLLNYVQAGHPREIVDDYAPGAGMAELEVDAQMAEELGPAAFALQIEGDSMEPEFVAGDRVIIDPDVSPRPGDYVVAKLEHEQAATFKKYRSRGIDSAGHEMFELVALNPNYLPIQVNGVNPGHIVGTMIEHRRYRRRG